MITLLACYFILACFLKNKKNKTSKNKLTRQESFHYHVISILLIL